MLTDLSLDLMRADQLAPGDLFFPADGGAMWVRTAKSDPDNRVLSYCPANHAAVYFGEAQMVLKLMGLDDA